MLFRGIKKVSEPSGPSRHFYFSLRSLIIAMTAIAVLCTLALILPGSLTHLVIGAIWIVAAGVFITGLFFAVGDERAFCIGATVALSSMWTGPGGRFMMGVHSIVSPLNLPQSVSLWLDLAVHALLVFVLGLLCIRARFHFQRNRFSAEEAVSGD